MVKCWWMYWIHRYDGRLGLSMPLISHKECVMIYQSFEEELNVGLLAKFYSHLYTQGYRRFHLLHLVVRRRSLKPKVSDVSLRIGTVKHWWLLITAWILISMIGCEKQDISHSICWKWLRIGCAFEIIWRLDSAIVIVGNESYLLKFIGDTRVIGCI